MRNHFNLWKSRLSLLVLLALLTGASPAWAQKALPYEYGFETALADEGWTMQNCHSMTNNYQIGSTSSYEGSFIFRFRYNTAPPQYLVSPEFSTSNKTVDVSFKYMAGGTYEESFKVGYSTTDNSIESFTWGDEIKTKVSSWTDYNVTLPAGTKYVCIAYTANDQYYLYIDNFAIESTPTCIKPTGLTATDPTESQVTLSWTSDADAWNVQYKKASESEWTTVENVTTNPYTLTGLSASSSYEVRVLTNCGGGDISIPTNTVSFSTTQVPVAADGFTEDFEGDFTWTIINGTMNNKWAWGTATANGGEKSLYVTNDNGTTNAYFPSSPSTIYATKLLSFEGGTYTVAYDWLCKGEGNSSKMYDFLRVFLVPSSTELNAATALPNGLTETALPTGWIALDNGSGLCNVTEWQHMSTDAAVPAGNYYLVAMWRNDNSTGTNPAGAIDNISIAAQACPRPAGLEISDITAHTATLTWATSSNTWEVYISTSEEAPAADVTVTASDIATNSYTFTGLNSETKYYAWVRAINGSDKSEWAGTNFTTGISCHVPTAFAASEITSSAATLTWTPAEGQDAWQIAYSTKANFDVDADSPTILDVTENATKTLTELTSATTYYARVRANCGGGDFSKWSNAISFTTLQVPVSAEDYTDDFETACNWVFVNGGQTNAWAWGNGASNGGEKGIYISNDGGTTNEYANSSTTIAYAKKLFSFEEKTYGFSFDWKGYGEGAFDYMRVALVPTTANLSTESVPSGFSASALPEGWIALDGGGKLNLKDSWQHHTAEIALTEGDYNVVFIWRNDNMYGENPAAAIDNFKVAILACPTPTELAVSDITAHTATLTWANAENITWEVYCSTSSEVPAADVTVTAGDITTNSYTFTNLVGETKYYVWVRSVSGSNRSEWAGANFTTEPSCIKPTNVMAAVGYNNATIIWTDDVEEQDTWELSYSTTSGAPNDGNIVTVNSKSYLLENLTPKTTYYVYVRAKCSDTDKSQWSEVCEFTPGIFTVNNGTETNQYVPIYGYYVDTSTKSQFIIPAASLTGLENSEIQNIIFHATNASVNWGNAVFDVYMSKVENTTFESATLVDWESMTQIYSGKLAIVDNKMVIQLSEPITYEGGNLLFGINLKTKGTYKSSSFYGVETEGYASLGGYNTTVTRYKFLPKISFEYEPVSDAAKMAVSTESINFGKVHPSFSDEAKQQTFTIKNKGKANLTNINVSYTGDDAFSTSAVENATIAANGDDITVTVTINTETPGNYSGTITVSADGQTNAEIAVSGTVLDANKMFENFAGNALPEDWETAGVGSYTTGSYSSSYKWTFTEGFASYKQSGSTTASLTNYEHSLVTPYMTFTEGEQLTFKYKKETQYASYLSNLRVEYTTDGSTWTQTAEDAITNTSFTSEWQDGSATIPATAKRVRFVGCGVAIDDIYGGQIAQIPVMAFENPGSFSFGVIAADSTSTAFTVKNTGRAEMTGLSITSDNENFIVAVADNATTIAAKSQATFTVTMKADAKGGQTGKITISADGIDPVEFNVSGYVLDNDAMLVDFAGNKLPDGWTKSNMYIVNNEIYVQGFGGTLTSPAITVAEGQSLLVYARSRATANAAITVKYSADNGETWTTAKNFTTELRKNTTDYAALIVDNIPAGDYILKFEADNVNISVINGYSYNQEAPALGVTLAAGTIITTGYNDNFGLKVKEAMSHTYTIKNTGTGTLTGTITSSVPAHFTVSQAEFSLAQDETLNFDLALVFDENYGEKASVVTIHPTNEGLEDIVINASATTKDPNIWEEDFENGMPAFWTNNGWSVSQPTSYMGGNGTKMAGPSSSKTATLITPRLQATEGQVLKYYVYAESETYFMKAEYSNDKSEWTLIDNYTDAGVKEFTAPADGNYYLRFTGYYTYLDNLEGFKLNLPQHDVNITEKRIPATGAQYVKYTATVTVKELLGKEEEVTAKFFIGETQFGEDVVETVSANGTKVFTVEFTPTEAVSGDAFFTITGTEINLSSEKQAVVISAATQLAETEAPELTDGTYASVVVTYTAHNGYNTICMPFALTDDDMKEIFGPNYEAYEFKSYKNRALNFGPATTFYKGYPYIVYTTAPTNNKLYKQNVEITATAKNDAYNNQNTSVNNSAKFQGTFAPMNSEELNGKLWMNAGGYLNEATEGVSLNGFRAFFEVAEGEEQVSYLTFTNANGQVTSISSLNADKVSGKAYNLKGQRVETMKKGNLYIIDGKKKLAK
ncbi:fibronectin type III domain-containing protein [Prevotella sp. E13-27]|uniref:fibronectin type III domain-containing protein n=1 Tax=Prevotella sp. E13-27 TaxID=2938122 RepID=UPI00200A7436|nr:fibronectin type III domain-containing protein [Prevotella sp. E13-27]MCK8621874.1 fibronectin type III domain-containing protein [Prevotella sp. E13-27]